jgi:hypothetical protein
MSFAALRLLLVRRVVAYFHSGVVCKLAVDLLHRPMVGEVLAILAFVRRMSIYYIGPDDDEMIC